MSEPMTTDQIANHIRNACRHNRQMTEATRQPAENLDATLHQRLPDITDADLAAVLLHVSSYITTLYDALRNGGIPDGMAAIAAVNTVGIAGEHIHRRAKAAKR